eukprot:m.34543 g.34543  ORF g.34543 m.34543 type:complete len:477 (-) comp6538_c0_seq1:82-1512(-)
MSAKEDNHHRPHVPKLDFSRLGIKENPNAGHARDRFTSNNRTTKTQHSPSLPPPLPPPQPHQKKSNDSNKFSKVAATKGQNMPIHKVAPPSNVNPSLALPNNFPPKSANQKKSSFKSKIPQNTNLPLQLSDFPKQRKPLQSTLPHHNPIIYDIDYTPPYTKNRPSQIHSNSKSNNSNNNKLSAPKALNSIYSGEQLVDSRSFRDKAVRSGSTLRPMHLRKQAAFPDPKPILIRKEQCQSTILKGTQSKSNAPLAYDRPLAIGDLFVHNKSHHTRIVQAKSAIDNRMPESMTKSHLGKKRLKETSKKHGKRHPGSVTSASRYSKSKHRHETPDIMGLDEHSILEEVASNSTSLNATIRNPHQLWDQSTTTHPKAILQKGRKATHGVVHSSVNDDDNDDEKAFFSKQPAYGINEDDDLESSDFEQMDGDSVQAKRMEDFDHLENSSLNETFGVAHHSSDGDEEEEEEDDLDDEEEMFA